MEEEWRKWLRENHPEHYDACIKSISWSAEWRDNEIIRLRGLIRNEHTEPPNDYGDDISTELAVKLAEAEELLRQWINASDAGDDHNVYQATKTLLAKTYAHMGDPCRYCGTPHDDVKPGPCPGLAKI